MISEVLTIRALVLENQALTEKVNELQEELNNIRKSFNIKSNSIMDNPGDSKYGMTKDQLIEGFKILKSKGAKYFSLKY